MLVKDIVTGSASSSPTLPTNMNGTLFFVAFSTGFGRELWKSDGTAAGTVIVKDIITGSGEPNIINMFNMDGTLYFSATSTGFGSEPWKTDGSGDGTVMVKNIMAGTTNSNPAKFTSVNGTVFLPHKMEAQAMQMMKNCGRPMVPMQVLYW